MPSLLGPSMAEEEEEDDRRSLEAKFAAAVKVIKSLPEEGPFQPSDDMMLMFYSYYKQATVGPCNIPRPSGFWDSRGRVKWDAWSSLGNMTKEEAMKNYVEDIQLILETIPISDEVSDLVQELGTFYTEVYRDGEEAESESGVDTRPFTRPFAQQHTGYGDLWDDIQNVPETDGGDGVCGMSASSEEAGGSNQSSETERKEDSFCWRSEEEENWIKEDSLDDEDKEEEENRGSNRGQRLRIAGDTRWRAATRSSCSSVEPSMSSFTNGTHSSLNSEVEEEELACSVEPSVQCSTCTHSNRRDHNALQRNMRSTDSDNEEFCDSMEHLAMEEGLPTAKIVSPKPGRATVRQKDLWFESSTTLNGGEDQAFAVDSHLTEGISRSQLDSSLSRRVRGTSSQRCTSVDDACCCLSQSSRAASRNVDEQIAAALLRLQRDMATIMHRLDALEALALSQSRSCSPRLEESLPLAKKLLRPSWWPFEFCPVTVVLTTLWPLVAHWLVRVYLQQRRRKIT
ncbi:acyl-CoA-binding domain-containing protein 5-B-like isoform X1 [Nelusetta ayraudi]|uniref:acyl-CoA-binding domain-containing protein 5-B-like isoform X1 n=1 Tax=Nelusetta ayraudi TaxID=303726 RepID=UPI003F717269